MKISKLLPGFSIKVDSVLFFFFFFQAEDGIRDTSVTGVQTCALPISVHAPVPRARPDAEGLLARQPRHRRVPPPDQGQRSEERRVGKECRSRWEPDD